MKYEIDLNSDMGENFGPWVIGDNVDKEIMPYISSANIATGFHAGDPNTMSQTIELAKYHGVAIGAHPGFPDLVGFGRRHINIQPQEIVNDIIYQLGALREFATLHQLPLQHIKPHGALYMHLAREQSAAQLFMETLHTLAPDLLLFCMQGSAIWQAAKKLQHPVICEFYADRDYDRSGSIVFTRRVGQLDPEQVAQKVLRACQEGKVRTVEGDDIPIVFDSVCIHSDTPGALTLIKATRERLNDADIHVKPPARIISYPTS
ncbi:MULTISPECIES: 5-oxoprolinase subunit PxpA [unclassified Brenneria]|uniref:5-oxoprolinase subunit PxpA n=1 Tax=unclassified Brenneria TaxID=2634434 RepID=UPI0015537E4E|nr:MULTISPECIES: 5-oxoprolinase subunit PxpA [unclassified Brenneria]MBJ7221776.1 5-oxoprolinase subunit PxpA [Brenneria sp. L3-3C-1]MEE3643017.1 5-oxoprolinase subunit PxpA [Brenneria sp. L3_3C_1]MEE3650796.1 5-oxoprolinase subunit PxpA [Brenneria sp. HEZEL_4_2_4]NPD00751.1 5-oxoprolinase subunit PxpA [Brenneria sp. hezel4-2-4]